MAKPKPLSLRRKSFGGQSGIGIWWRKRFVPTTSIPTDDEGLTNDAPRHQDSSNNESPSTEDSPFDHGTVEPMPLVGTTEESSFLGWDDDLCRPIYRRRHQSSHNHKVLDDQKNDLVRAVSSSSSGGIKMIDDTDTTDDSIDSIRDDKDIDASGNITDDTISVGVAAASPFAEKEAEENGIGTRRGDEVNKDSAPVQIPVMSRKRTQTFGSQGKRRRPLSLILTEDEVKETPYVCGGNSRRVSLESSPDVTANEGNQVTGNDCKKNHKQSDPPPKPRKLRRSNRFSHPSSDDPPIKEGNKSGSTSTIFENEVDLKQADPPPRPRKLRRSTRNKTCLSDASPTEEDNNSGGKRTVSNNEKSRNRPSPPPRPRKPRRSTTNELRSSDASPAAKINESDGTSVIKKRDFSGERNAQPPPPPRKARRSSRIRPSIDLDCTLEKARAYFENLDKTQELTLDATRSPHVSSRVTRTRRRTNLSSPGINRAYNAYSRSIVGDGTFGIEPLCIQDYAASRQLHFQNKGQIIDGFLDD